MNYVVVFETVRTEEEIAEICARNFPDARCLRCPMFNTPQCPAEFVNRYCRTCRHSRPVSFVHPLFSSSEDCLWCVKRGRVVRPDDICLGWQRREVMVRG